MEYLVGPLGSGLKDRNSYVRMVAVIGVLKLYHISSSTCMDADLPAILKHLMINDSDTQVRSFFFFLYFLFKMSIHSMLARPECL